MTRLNLFVAVALSLGIFSGCKEEKILVHSVAQESLPPAAAPATSAPAAPASAGPTAPRPEIAYTLPAGWEDLGQTSMSLANFKIKTPAGEASVNITPLASMAGQEALIVNMWREQVGQPPLAESAIASTFTPVAIGSDAGQLFSIKGMRDKQAVQIVTAFAHRDGASWFYKLQGPEAVIAAEQPAFVAFLKTVRFQPAGTTPAPATSAQPVAVAGGGSAPLAAAGSPATPEPAAFQWKVPAGWQSLTPGQMQVAKFSVPEKAGGKAEVFVSVFPSDTGGMLANVNRWRKQVGLEPIDDPALKPLVTAIDGLPGATLVELKNDSRAIIGAIVPRSGRWWFYKLIGDSAVVTAEREALIRFVQTAP